MQGKNLTKKVQDICSTTLSHISGIYKMFVEYVEEIKRICFYVMPTCLFSPSFSFGNVESAGNNLSG